MGKRSSPEKTSNRERNWVKFFNALVQLSQNLHKEKQILEERVEYFRGSIYKMKMEQRADSLKAELILGLKEREATVLKHRYENAVSDVADFSEWCDYLVQKSSGSTDISNKEESSQKKALQDEVRKLKSEISAYKVEKSSEISSLLSEKSFVWNQYKQMETSLTEQIRHKSDEAENANKKAHILVSRVDELHATNEKLMAHITMMESESIQKDEKILELMKEIESLKSQSGSASTLLRPCRADAGKSSRTTRQSNAKLKKESDFSQTTEKGISGSKRKANNVIVIPDTPKLFTSSFKVPKLKISSS